MSKLTPYFDLDGTRYEIKKTRWLVAEYDKMRAEAPITKEDRIDAAKANNLIHDAQMYSEKAAEYWEILCKEPTVENQSAYMLFKNMCDKAVADYNEFIGTHDAIKKATAQNLEILRKTAIKGLAEQYDMNEADAGRVWERFADTQNNNVSEWLHAMAECLFSEEDEEENNGFLSEKRKKDAERENNRRNGFNTKK